MNSIADELQRLSELHGAGALTDKEFSQAKAAVIKQALLSEVRAPCVSDGSSRPVEPITSSCPGWDRFLEERLRGASKDLYAEWQTLTESHLLTRVLRFTEGNQVQAAKILGMARNSLRSKMRAFSITTDRSVGSDDPEDE